MICEFGMYARSPFSDRMTVVRKLNCSTIPATWAGSMRTKSPTLYQRSKPISVPAITSIRKRCAPKPTMMRTSAEPPIAVTLSGRNALATRMMTAIAATYGIAVATSASAVSPRRSLTSSRSSFGCRASSRATTKRRRRDTTMAATMAATPHNSLS